MTLKSRTPILCLVLTLLATSTLLAHLTLTKSAPDADATVPAPQKIQVWFNQVPDLPVSQIELQGPSGDVTLGETKEGEERSLVADVPSALGPGTYTVSWRTAGDDGHVRRGEFSFAVRSAD